MKGSKVVTTNVDFFQIIWKELWNEQAIKTAIISENLRPSIPRDIPFTLKVLFFSPFFFFLHDAGIFFRVSAGMKCFFFFCSVGFFFLRHGNYPFFFFSSEIKVT